MTQIGIQPYPFSDPKNINRLPEYDQIFKAPIGIDVAHHEIHEGDAFTYCDVVALGNGAIQNYLITTPNTGKWAHLGYDIDFNDGAGLFEIFEATDKVGTTLQTAYNHNRNVTSLSTTIVHKDISGGTTDGTKICMRRSGSRSISGQVGSSAERVLKQNTKYIIRLTNLTATTNNLSFEIYWYEHTSG